MSFSRKAAFGYVPFLSRVVLAAAFIPAGWDKIMAEPAVYHGADAALLRLMGVGETPTALTQQPVYQDGASSGPLRDRVRPRPAPAPPPVVKVQSPKDEEPEPDEEVEPDQEPVTEEEELAPPMDDEPVEEIAPEPQPEPEPEPKVLPAPAKPEPPQVPPVRARRLYGVALMLARDGRWPVHLHPDWMAWAAAGTELVGGALILIGLFSRVWGAGLAIAMAVAFYLTTLTDVTTLGPLNLPPDVLNRAFAQIGLFTFALGITMTGAGRLSLDRMFFPGNFEDDEHLLQLG